MSDFTTHELTKKLESESGLELDCKRTLQLVNSAVETRMEYIRNRQKQIDALIVAKDDIYKAYDQKDAKMLGDIKKKINTAMSGTDHFDPYSGAK